MEFRFNLNEIFQQPIVEIGNSLIPPGFSGDKRALWDTQSKITQIVNAMGEASAHAQGLTKSITTADRLRNSEHRLYLMLDQTANNGKGAVTGMLKTGEKGLYVFDREGQHYQVSPPCVLDFYIHESRQRSGFGKRLFEHMLQKEQIEPVKMAIDRPSDKFLGFLNKHYGLNTPVKQMNNYVVFDGFFPRSSDITRTVEADKSRSPSKRQSANGLQAGFASSPYGRYGAPRPTCSMGQIIHNDSAVIKCNQELSGVRSEPVTNTQGQVKGNCYYGNLPAWQTTQSVPNMHYPNSQNQQICNPDQMKYVHNRHQYPQNQSAISNYLASSGDYQNYNQEASTLSQNQARACPQTENNMYQNYLMAHGDATSQLFRPQGMISTPQEIQNIQPQYPESQNIQYNAQIEQMTPAADVSHNTLQNVPQPFNPQAQSLYFIQQDTRNQLPNINLEQQSCHGQDMHQSVTMREPLIPQNVDGALKNVQHTVRSLSAQGDENQCVVLQNSASAPLTYQQQGIGTEQNIPQAQAYQATTMSQMGYIKKTISQKDLQKQTNILQTTPNSNVHQVALHSQLRPLNLQQHATSNQQQTYNSVTQQQTNSSGAIPQMTIHNPSSQQIPIQTGTIGYINAPPSQIADQNPFGSVPQIGTPNEASALQNQPGLQLTLQSQPNLQMNHQGQPNTQTIQQSYASNPMNAHAQVIDPVQTENQNVINPSPNTAISHPHVSSPTVFSKYPHIDNQTGMTSEQYQNFNQVATVASNTATPTLHQYNHYLVENQMQINQQQPSPTRQHETNQMQINQQQQSPNRQRETNQQPNINVEPQTGNPSQLEVSRFGQNNATRNTSVPSVNIGSTVEQETRHAQHVQEVDLSKGYPPQHYENCTPNSTPKADRPNSLNIEPTEDVEEKMSYENKVEINEEGEKEGLDGNHEDIDSLEGDTVAEVEQEIQNFQISPKINTPFLKGSKSPVIEAAGIVTPGRSTPGLTEQGYFDLKFYHNKLW